MLHVTVTQVSSTAQVTSQHMSLERGYHRCPFAWHIGSSDQHWRLMQPSLPCIVTSTVHAINPMLRLS